MNRGKQRILLGDDHTVLRIGLRLLLNAEPDLEVSGEAADGEEVLQRVRELVPDVVLLDLTMPKMNGIECIRHIMAERPETKIVVLTMHDDEEYLRAALCAGARGYVLKKAADVELLSAIRTVVRGEIFVYPSMAASMLYHMVHAPSSVGSEKKAHLSERETEVLRLLALGHTNQEIADILYVSVKTVETYKARVMDKLELHRRAELVRYALENGVISG